jgi:hypothetical protein
MKHQPRFRITLIFVSISLYLSFYLFSPFSHHHHDEIQANGEDVFHSHFLSVAAQQESSAEHHHSINRTHNHNHLPFSNTSLTNLIPRFTHPSMVALHVNTIYGSEKEDNVLSSSFNKFAHNWKHLRDKCIRTATNVSPPFDLAA